MLQYVYRRKERIKMKFIVDSLPTCPYECLFCQDSYKEICPFDNTICVFSDSPKLGEYQNVCPYLIEFNAIRKEVEFE